MFIFSADAAVSVCICVSVSTCTHTHAKWRSNRSDQQLGQRHCVPASRRSHRTMGLFLWCNWSIRQNKGRACCSACASSIMHKRCTDRILLVKHDTCKSPALSLVWHCSVRGRYVAITAPRRPSDFVIIAFKFVLWGFDPIGLLYWNWTVRTRKYMKWYSEFTAGQTPLMAKPHRKTVIENKALYGFTEKWVIPL